MDRLESAMLNVMPRRALMGWTRRALLKPRARSSSSGIFNRGIRSSSRAPAAKPGSCITSILNEGAARVSTVEPGVITDRKFHDVSGFTLEAIQDVLEDYADDHPHAQLDVEYADGVLTLLVGSCGTFVLNKQSPNKQIWLSSPVSGPLRYNLSCDGMWVESRSERDSLLVQLAADFNELAADQVDFAALEKDIHCTYF